MNRAILVVICDFVVLSMLSLTSLSPAAMSGGGESGGGQHAILDAATSRAVLEQLRVQADRLEAARQKLLEEQLAAGATPDGQAQLEQLNQELAAARVQLEYLTKRLALTAEELAEMTPEQLKQLLDAEARNRELMTVRNEQLNSELEFFRAGYQQTTVRLTETSEKLAAAQERIAATQDQLSETRGDLNRRNQSLQELGSTLDTTRQELTTTATRLTERERELLTTRDRLTGTITELEQNRDHLKTYQADLAFTQGQLEATVRELDTTGRDLAEARARLELEKRNIQSKDLEVNELRRQLADTRKLLTTTVSDLTAAQTELKSSSSEAASATAMLADLKTQFDSAKGQLQQAEAQLKSDVTQQYADAVARLDFALREKRMLMDHSQTRQFFLPEIVLDGRRFLITELRSATGFDRGDFSDEISQLSYRSRPGTAPEESATVDLTTLYLPAVDRRVALFETPGSAAKALRPLTYPELVKRGPQELYLFKQRSYGTESCLLDTRASLSMDPKDPYLYVRNSNRSATELRAEPGDFILSKQGDFVGVIVATETYDLGSKEEAKCFVFPAAPVFADATTIDLAAADANGFHVQFAQTIRDLLGTLRELDARQRKR